MILSVLHDLEKRSIGFTLAFPQADLYIDVFIELPVGFNLEPDSRQYIIKLNKSLYGLKQTDHNLFELLKDNLEARVYDY